MKLQEVKPIYITRSWECENWIAIFELSKEEIDYMSRIRYGTDFVCKPRNTYENHKPTTGESMIKSSKTTKTQIFIAIINILAFCLLIANIIRGFFG